MEELLEFDHLQEDLDMSDIPGWLKEKLKENEFKHYHAFYKEVRTNHRSMAMLALHRLGQSRQRIEKYCEAMKDDVPEFDGNEEKLNNPQEIDYIQSSSYLDYRGKNVGYYKLYRLFQQIYEDKYKKDVKQMIKDICEDVIDGPLYGAFHSFIQIAYGLVGNHDVMVVEGITWMYQQYSPMFIDDVTNQKRIDLQPFGRGTVNLEDTVKKLQDVKLVKQLQDENERDMTYRKEIHYSDVYGWSAVKYHSDFFMDVTNGLKLPDWFRPEEKDMSQLKRLFQWLFDTATLVYVRSSSVNNFFLLHGITGSWSLAKVLALFPFDTALIGLRAFLAQLFMTYVLEGAPELNKNVEDFVHMDVCQKAWDQLIEAEVTNEDAYEYHVFKVTQCLYERWKENPDTEFSKYYIAGACAAKDNDYTGIDMSNKMAYHIAN